MTLPVRTPWQSPMAGRAYVASALWLAGSGLAWLSGEPDVRGWLHVRFDAAGLLLLLAAAVGGYNFFPKGVRAVRRLRLDMNFLMTAAILGALLIGEPIEAAAIAALFSLAELLEAAAVFRTRRSIEELIALAPERARRVAPSGAEEEVVASALRKGDRLRVRPGEKVPIDGRVADGASAVDEATVTGESVPVAKEVGDAVFAGTLLVEGYLEIEATTDAGDTALDRIVRLVREAQTRRAPSERYIERFAKVYTPTITVLAVAAMVLPPLIGLGSWAEWFVRGLTLLVIACPCALVIATPVTIMTAITSAARHGVLIKGGEYIETLGATCAFAFDKTGSLTEGRLAVTDVVPLDAESADDLLSLAAAVERRSEHPIARAVVAHATERGMVARPGAVSEFRARPGHGVTARVDGREVSIGKPGMFDSLSPPSRAEVLQADGKTTVLVVVDGRLAGLIALADRVRPHAADAVRALERLGIHETVMLTGDNERVARSVAAQLHISDVRAGILPEQKARAIEQYKAKHGRVAMLGDGVNDAPALAVADVGIAMGGAASPASMETADVVLLGEDLRLLPYAVRVAQRARRLLRFNVGLAVGLKLVLAVGALFGTVSLLVAVLLGDMGASLAVTLNAMRIARLEAE